MCHLYSTPEYCKGAMETIIIREKYFHLKKSASVLDLEEIYYKHHIAWKIRNLKIFQAIRR